MEEAFTMSIPYGFVRVGHAVVEPNSGLAETYFDDWTATIHWKQGIEVALYARQSDIDSAIKGGEGGGNG